MTVLVSRTYIHDLWAYAARLEERAERAHGAEREILREKADEVLGEIESYIGVRPRNGDELAALVRAA